MTADQFDALAQLLRLRIGPAQAAARRVLVDGARSTEAALAEGVSAASVSNAVARVRRGLELARIASGR